MRRHVWSVLDSCVNCGARYSPDEDGPQSCPGNDSDAPWSDSRDWS